MEIKTYNKLPPEARQIRTDVFVTEQGFLEEFDQVDDTAWHLVVFEDGEAAGTCRVFWNEEKSAYVVGRLAVLSKYRGKNLGTALLEAVHEKVEGLGGKEIYLHAQYDKASFYEKAGYVPVGEMDEEQGYPHVWMKKVMHHERCSPGANHFALDS